MDYQILSNENPEQLRKEVLELMENGWRPLGGVAIEATVANRIQIVFHQAMIYEPI